MERKFIPFSDEVSLGGFQQRFQVVVREPYRASLDLRPDTPHPYETLAERAGISLKRESRTEIRLWETGAGTLYFKHYFYPGPARLKTLAGSMPKAKREYLTLGFLKHLDIPGVEPVGWGVRWTSMGAVRSCFILTRSEKDVLDFRAWLKKAEPAPNYRDRTVRILRKLAGFFRKLHGRRFFLLRPNTRNVLVQEGGNGELRVLFLDQPYARFLSGPGATWGQMKDLSTLLGGVLRHHDDEVIADFLAVYLPDPLGKSPEILRRRLMLALKARESDGRGKKLILRCRALLPAFTHKP